MFEPNRGALPPFHFNCSEDTLRLHFSQYGVVEAAEVMKDRFSGKSRGFGFVTFVDPAAAQRALGMEHTVDGRRCEAKIALPKVWHGYGKCYLQPSNNGYGTGRHVMLHTLTAVLPLLAITGICFHVELGLMCLFV